MTNIYEKSSPEESSMEDILSSIRQILASDEDADHAPKEKLAAKSKSSISYHDDVIDLTEEVHTVHTSSVPAEDKTENQKFESTKKEESHTMTTLPEQDAKLISQKTVEAASHALSKLNEALHPSQSTPVAHTSVGGSVTLEALVSQAMQPILKDWMDQNLPRVIESVVAAEIKKLVRQAT